MRPRAETRPRAGNGLRVLILALALACTISVPKTCAARDYDFYVQVVGGSIDERALRHTIALELSEIDIPKNPLIDDDTDVSLHIEVTDVEGKLTVGLWDRGELAGRRTVSASGAPRLVARRVSLAVAELARDLRDRRIRQLRVLAQERHFIEKRALVSAYRAQQRALGLRAGLRTEVVPQGGFLFGPTLGAEFNGHFPVRFVVGLDWGTGFVGALRKGVDPNRSPPWSKWQLEWGVDWVGQPVLTTQLSVGAHFSAFVAHVGGGADVDRIDGQSETWGAQLGGRISWAIQQNMVFWPRLEVEAGRILRPLPLRFGMEEIELGGWYASLGMSLVMFQ